MLCVCWGSNQYKLKEFPEINEGLVHQDIHWCQIHKSKLFCEILVFVLSWPENTTAKKILKSKDFNRFGDSNDLKLSLKGKKLIFFDKKYDAPRNQYVPMYDKEQRIIGHQWLPCQKTKKGIFFQLKLIDDKNYKFKTDLSFSDYKEVYRKEKCLRCAN